MLQLIVMGDKSICLSLFLIVVQILEFLMVWMDDAFLAQVQVSISEIFLQKLCVYI